MRTQTRPATDEIGMRCKPLFYCSRWPLVVGNAMPCPVIPSAVEGPCVSALLPDVTLSSHTHASPSGHNTHKVPRIRFGMTVCLILTNDQ